MKKPTLLNPTIILLLFLFVISNGCTKKVKQDNVNTRITKSLRNLGYAVSDSLNVAVTNQNIILVDPASKTMFYDSLQSIKDFGIPVFDLIQIFPWDSLTVLIKDADKFKTIVANKNIGTHTYHLNKYLIASTLGDPPPPPAVRPKIEDRDHGEAEYMPNSIDRLEYFFMLDHFDDLYSRVPRSPQNVTKIGLLDSGIDPTSQSAMILHNEYTTQGTGAMETMYRNGYNLIDENSITIDENGHGSLITSIFYSRLKNEKVRVVPFKIVDGFGITSSFLVSGAIKLAQQQRISYLNLSFGSYVEDSVIKKALISYIEKGDGNYKVFTSAGNSGCMLGDTIEHYPSSYSTRYYNDIFEVCAYKPLYPPRLAEYSNWRPRGTEALTILGNGSSHIPFYAPADHFTNNSQGTSYACPRALIEYIKDPSRFSGTAPIIIE